MVKVLGRAGILAALALAAGTPAGATIYKLTVSGTIANADNPAYAYDLTDRTGLFTTAGGSLAGKAFSVVYTIDTAQPWLVTPPGPGGTTTVYNSGINPYYARGEAITAAVTIGGITVGNIGVGGSTIPSGADTESQIALTPSYQFAINTGISETSYTRGATTIGGFNIRVNNGLSNAYQPGTPLTAGGGFAPFELNTGQGSNGLVSFAGNGQATTFAYFNIASAKMEVASVPEPASWAMMIGGFGMVGAAARRRTRRLKTA